MIFQFDEEMMKACLEANGWSYGWQQGRWVHSTMNADHCDYTLKDAFEIELMSKNLYGKQFEYAWKD